MSLKPFFKVLLLLAFLSTFTCYAQDPVYFKIGADEFTNTEVYSVLYDDVNDIVYAGTNNGLYAYKQNHFARIKQVENQKGNAVFSLKQNKKGEVYCNNLNGQILKVNNDHLELIYQSNEKTKSSYFWFHFVENNNLLVVTNNSITRVSKTTTKEVLFYEKNTIKSCSKTSKGIYIQLNHTKNGNSILNYNEKLLKKIRNTTPKEIGIISNFIVQKESLYAKEKIGKILNLSGTPLNVNFKSHVKEVFHSVNDSLVIALSVQKGVRYIYLENNSLTASKTFFKNTFISTFAVSKNGTLLLGTFNDGVIVIPNYKVIKTSKIDELFLGIATTPNNTVGLSTRSGAIYSYKNNALHLIDKVPHNVDAIYYFDSINPKKNLKNQFLYNKIGSDFIGSKDIVKLNPNVFAFSHQEGITIKNVEPSKPLKNLAYLSIEVNGFSLIEKQRVKALAWNKKDSIIYFTTMEGLFKKRWSSNKTNPILLNNKPFLVNDITMLNNTLLCGSNKGVFILKDEKPIFTLQKKDGLLSHSVRQVMLKDSILYILTKEGMQLYNMQTNKFLDFGVKEGVVAKNTKRFTLSKDKLWLLEKNSFSSIAINSLTDVKKNTIAKLYIDSILVNSKRIDFIKEKQFPYTDNQVAFYVDYRNIETKAETTIQYKLNGFDKDWQSMPSTHNKINYSSLPTGQYTFKVKASYRDVATKPFEYSFNITPPFWKTWWFYTIITLILISVILFWLQATIKKQKNLFKTQKLKTELLDSELKALRSQMNPHFIFNALNSIQGLILEKKTNQSYDYIVLFANLVRNTLNYSSKDFIAIQDELSFLKTYLKLEKLRFGDEFSYTINYTGKQEIEVPSLLVQPFIENALLHGLLHKKDNKTLTITFALKNETLSCTIIDNGVGREKAKIIQERQGKRHQSFALNAISSRLRMLSEKTGNTAKFTTTDLYNYDIPLGTKVVIIMPYKTVFE